MPIIEWNIDLMESYYRFLSNPLMIIDLLYGKYGRKETKSDTVSQNRTVAYIIFQRRIYC